MYELLRDEYDIQIEFGDLSNILAYLSVGDRLRDLERLVGALSEIRRQYKKSRSGMLSLEYISPRVILAPQTAFYAPKETIPLRESAGRVCCEFVTTYPPGIPALAPGEEITGEIIEYVCYAKERGCFLTGTEDPAAETIQVLKQEKRMQEEVTMKLGFPNSIPPDVKLSIPGGPAANQPAKSVSTHRVFARIFSGIRPLS